MVRVFVHVLVLLIGWIRLLIYTGSIGKSDVSRTGDSLSDAELRPSGHYGASFAFPAVMVTVMLSANPEGSVALTITVYVPATAPVARPCPTAS